MRHLIAIFFLLLLSSQVLPLRQVGKFLFKSQLTEEIHHGGSHHASGGDDALKLLPSCNPAVYAQERIALLRAVIALHMQVTEHIPDDHQPEIPTPPPNRA